MKTDIAIPITYLRELAEANGYELTEKKKENIYPRIWSFKSNYEGHLITLKENGLYSNENQNGCLTIDSMLHKGGCVDNGDFIIYQVETVPGVILTVGDKVKPSIRSIEFIIKRFDYDYGTIYAFDGNGHWMIACCVKVEKKEPYFVTEDGVEVEEHTLIHGVDECYYHISSPCFLVAKESHSNKWFSTRKAADKYIYENEPIKSRKEIREWIKSNEVSGVKTSWITDKMTNDFLK